MRNVSRSAKTLFLRRISAGGDVFTVSVVPEEGTVPAALHYHSGCELQMITEGEMSLFAGEQTRRLTAGDICLIGENVYHYLMEAAPSARTSICFTRRPARREGHVLTPNGAGGVVVFRDERLFSVLSMLREEIASGGEDGLADALLAVIVGRSLRLCGDQNADEAKNPARSLDDVREVMIDDYFSDRYDEELTPEELADMLGISTRHLSRILQEIYNKSFSEVLTDMRMEAAKDLLKNSALKQGDIAAAVGYRQPSNFFRTFRAREGCTPGVYRARHRSEHSD